MSRKHARKAAYQTSSPGWNQHAHKPGRTYAARRATAERLGQAPPEPDKSLRPDHNDPNRDDSLDDMADVLDSATDPLEVKFLGPAPSKDDLAWLALKERWRLDGGADLVGAPGRRLPMAAPSLIKPRSQTSTATGGALKPAYVRAF